MKFTIKEIEKLLAMGFSHEQIARMAGESPAPVPVQKQMTKKQGTGKPAPKTAEPKTEGKVINSKKGISVKMEIVDGQGKGEGKQYVKLTFGEKPSQTVRDQMKLHHFKFFHIDNTWSAYKTDKAVAFAQSLIK